MDGIDFLKIMKDGLAGITESEYDTLVRLLRPVVMALKDSSLNPKEAITDFLDDMFFNLSNASVRRRERIVRLAEKKHENPGLRSKYCLRVLSVEFRRRLKKQIAKNRYPHNHLLYRQVVIHLKTLREEGVLQSQEIPVPSGGIFAVLWGLSEWGPDMQNRKARFTMKKLIKTLPSIPTGKGGKGLFQYAKVLPEFLPLILTLYDAPLLTAEFKAVVRSKVPGLHQATIVVPFSPENESGILRLKDGSHSYGYELGTDSLPENEAEDEGSRELAQAKSRLLRRVLTGNMNRKE
jgi:hypothetical protein